MECEAFQSGLAWVHTRVYTQFAHWAGFITPKNPGFFNRMWVFYNLDLNLDLNCNENAILYLL